MKFDLPNWKSGEVSRRCISDCTLNCELFHFVYLKKKKNLGLWTWTRNLLLINSNASDPHRCGNEVNHCQKHFSTTVLFFFFFLIENASSSLKMYTSTCERTPKWLFYIASLLMATPSLQKSNLFCWHFDISDDDEYWKRCFYVPQLEIDPFIHCYCLNLKFVFWTGMGYLRKT